MWRSAHALFRTLAPIRAKFATRDLRWPRRLSSVSPFISPSPVLVSQASLWYKDASATDGSRSTCHAVIHPCMSAGTGI
ncbi:hypothetical protein EDD15DRAFT_504790 [Pisolithus albus]|nr:hypothetical protein EDD15DRAFT_504790 [Pisolithus albus]